MKRRTLFLLALPFAILACNNEAKDSVEKADSINDARADTTSAAPAISVDQSTSEFMVKVADVGMTEVQLGNVAQQKSGNQRIKDFGAMMVKDHSAAGDELKSLASRKNVVLPTAVGQDHQTKIDELSKKAGKAFDKEYIDMMVDGHEKTIADFERISSNTSDADVKAWVDKTLPGLRHHLDEAKAIKASLK
jgi:putative membrane protein